MKIKVNKLTGAALDWAVAKCEYPELIWGETIGLSAHIQELIVIPQFKEPKCWWCPSTLWIQGGPIIERERIELIRWDGTWGVEEGTWVANIQHEDKRFGGMMLSEGQGTTPLIAAMKCYVASRLCDQFTNEVDVPDELLK